MIVGMKTTFSALLLALLVACSRPPAVDRQADEAAIRALEASWSAAAGAKQLDTVVSFYADDAASFNPNVPIATTKEAIRKNWADMLGLPSAAVTWQVAKVDVSTSGDMAYAHGTYQFSFNDPQGHAVQDHGKFLDVFKKQTDGKWKAVADIFNTDLPSPPPPAK